MVEMKFRRTIMKDDGVGDNNDVIGDDFVGRVTKDILKGEG